MVSKLTGGTSRSPHQKADHLHWQIVDKSSYCPGDKNSSILSLAGTEIGMRFFLVYRSRCLGYKRLK